MILCKAVHQNSNDLHISREQTKFTFHIKLLMQRKSKATRGKNGGRYYFDTFYFKLFHKNTDIL